MVDLVTLAIPFVYLTILVGSLATFSSLYRKRKTAKATSLEPWFPPHLQRNIYYSLVSLEPQPGQEKVPTVPDSVLKAALLRRATEDIHRIMQIRSSKQALATLLQRGSVGDDLWQRFQRAEAETEDELRDVVNEANAFSPNWGPTIFQSAHEMANNAALRKRIDDLQSQTQSEKEWWEQRRATIQTEFMKELDGGVKTSTDPSIPIPANRSKATTPSIERQKEQLEKERERGTATSDEDTVLVEAGGPTATGTGKGGAGSAKKRKGKK